MEYRFSCTACGKCCFGWLPLTVNEAILHAGRFPLALVWSTIPQGAKNFTLATQLGITPKSRKRFAVLIMPTAYIPPSLPCPELTDENLCGIHQTKPVRCKTMPFFPYRVESDQANMLKPRTGWLCDTSHAAPVVYQNKVIVERGNFDLERRELREQVAVMQQYADYMFKYSPWIIDNLTAISSKPDGNIVTSLSSFLTAIKHLDGTAMAAKQLPVLEKFAQMTASNPALADYHRNYAGWAKEMSYLANRVTPR